MKKSIFALLAIAFSFTLIACEAEHTQNVPATQNSNDSADNSSQSESPKEFTVCYQLTCLKTIQVSTSEAGKDYVYPASADPQYRAPYAYLDLNTLDPKLKVAKNFSLGEFLQASKGRYGILLPIAVTSAQAIRDALNSPVIITSGYRSPGYNSRIDGAATRSRHMYGDALDMGANSQKALERECIAKNASYVLSYSDGHVHCDWRNISLDPAFYPPLMTPTTEKTFQVYSKYLSSKMQIEWQNGFFKVTLPEEVDLDEGLPTFQWTIRNAHGDIIGSSREHFLKVKSARGTYQIEVVVGGTLSTSTIVEW